MIFFAAVIVKYKAISRKVAPVIRDAWSLFHSPRCTMVDSYCEQEFQVGNT